MSQVPTVRGPVSSAGLGPTYMHEHIFTLTADVQQNYPQAHRSWCTPIPGPGPGWRSSGCSATPDASCYIDRIDPAVLPFLAQWHYLHIGDEVLPYVRDRGVTEDEITTMLIENPRRFFETAASG